jgi:hypothetical protein
VDAQRRGAIDVIWYRADDTETAAALALLRERTERVPGVDDATLYAINVTIPRLTQNRDLDYWKARRKLWESPDTEQSP